MNAYFSIGASKNHSYMERNGEEKEEQLCPAVNHFDVKGLPSKQKEPQFCYDIVLY